MLNINKTTEKDCKKRLVKDIKIYQKQKSIKSDNIVVNDIKIYLTKIYMKNKCCLSIEKNTRLVGNCKKRHINIFLDKYTRFLL